MSFFLGLVYINHIHFCYVHVTVNAVKYKKNKFIPRSKLGIQIPNQYDDKVRSDIPEIERKCMNAIKPNLNFSINLMSKYS